MTIGLPPQNAAAPDSALLGSLIRGHRLRIGLTQRQLADLSTISVRAIRDLEKGKAQRPRTDTVRLIADALRLGPRARTALEEAARRGHRGGGDGRHTGAERPSPPVPLHPVIGRDAETAVVVEELRSGAERLVTVVGLSGMGKTRVALEAAARLHEAGLSVLWHTAPGPVPDFLPAEDDSFTALTGECAAYLHGGGQTGERSTRTGELPQRAGELPAQNGELSPWTGESLARTGELPARLADLAGSRGILLVLDGVDTGLLDGHRLNRLLRDVPGLRVLVTAEEPWDVPCERLFLLSPLEAPAPPDGSDSPATRFFLSRLRRVRPDIAADARSLADIGRICHRLDGHPMALVAAASWLAVCDLPTLCGIVESDPAALLDHLSGDPAVSRLPERTARTISRLPAGHQRLLSALHEADADEFDLGDVVRLTGLPLPNCGRMVRDLLVSGVIRASTETGRSAFRVLCVVRALAPAPTRAPAPAPATAAAAATAADAAP
ncbi:AAA family ATPase [Streptomyces griseus]|uniref:AAA family ATPase n=1 Tax=Streptomyces stephensoniae TaxID=3375367 RepID=A0ABU2VX68_9ACTN|nr:AAA family ATPase [Streptomyces griseus]MDT0490190.1 AAA family ATPase [Streptomyces griseus]